MTWHMFHYGGRTPKPHYAYANSMAIFKLHKGKLKGWKKRKQEEGHVATCEVYHNKEGKTCWKGTKRLRETETLNCNSFLDYFYSDEVYKVEPFLIIWSHFTLAIN